MLAKKLIRDMFLCIFTHCFDLCQVITTIKKGYKTSFSSLFLLTFVA